MTEPTRNTNGHGLSPGAAVHCLGRTILYTGVIVVILAFLSMLQPGLRIPGKAREAEVKQNLHAIQLAIERYATDHDGLYPRYLYGGDSIFNAGTVNHYNPYGVCSETGYDRRVHNPFDTRNIASDIGFDYADMDWETLVEYSQADDSTKTAEILTPMWDSGQVPAGEYPPFGDVLAVEGYIPKYPRNPFARSGGKSIHARLLARHELYSLGDGLGAVYSLYGGRDGRSMFNLGPFGELVQLSLFEEPSDEPRLDFPGCFYYHPRFKDSATVHGHLKAQQQSNPEAMLPGDYYPELNPPLCDEEDIRSPHVGGYDLFATGSPRTNGYDIDNSVGLNGAAHAFRAGYATLARERNPWVQAGDYDGVSDFDERPCSDGFPDYFIIHLGSGMKRQPAPGDRIPATE